MKSQGDLCSRREVTAGYPPAVGVTAEQVVVAKGSSKVHFQGFKLQTPEVQVGIKCDLLCFESWISKQQEETEILDPQGADFSLLC